MLAPQGFELLSVAMDAGGAQAAAPFVPADVDFPDVVASLPASAVDWLRTVQPFVQQMQIEPEAYVAALRDGVARGADSPYALSAEEALERSAPRPAEQAAYAPGEHLHVLGERDASVRWFRESHRLQPESWTYRRQARPLVAPSQGPTQEYDGDWLSDVRRTGAAAYDAPVELEPRR